MGCTVLWGGGRGGVYSPLGGREGYVVLDGVLWGGGRGGVCSVL